jgi:hypothetical protein
MGKIIWVLRIIRIAIEFIGALGGLAAFIFGLIFVALTFLDHGAGNAWGGGRVEQGQHYLFAAGHYTEVSAVMFWSVWLTQIIGFSGAGLFVLTLLIEGIAWLLGWETYLFERRRP